MSEKTDSLFGLLNKVDMKLRSMKPTIAAKPSNDGGRQQFSDYLDWSAAILETKASIQSLQSSQELTDDVRKAAVEAASEVMQGYSKRALEILAPFLNTWSIANGIAQMIVSTLDETEKRRDKMRFTVDERDRLRHCYHLQLVCKYDVPALTKALEGLRENFRVRIELERVCFTDTEILSDVERTWESRNAIVLMRIKSPDMLPEIREQLLTEPGLECETVTVEKL